MRKGVLEARLTVRIDLSAGAHELSLLGSEVPQLFSFGIRLTASSYAEGGKDGFFLSSMVQDAVLRNLEIIGEAAKNLPPG